MTWKKWSEDLRTFSSFFCSVLLRDPVITSGMLATVASWAAAFQTPVSLSPNRKNVYKTLNSFFLTLDFIQDCNQISQREGSLESKFYLQNHTSGSLSITWKNKGVSLVLWEHRTSIGRELCSAVATSHPPWRKVALRWKDSCQLGCAEELPINIAHKPAWC